MSGREYAVIDKFRLHEGITAGPFLDASEALRNTRSDPSALVVVWRHVGDWNMPPAALPEQQQTG